MSISSRVYRASFFGAVLLCFCALSGAAFGFGFDDVAKRAHERSLVSFKKPNPSLPKELQDLDYDRYWDIRYKPEEHHWRRARLPFELAFFHLGRHFREPVRINEVVGNSVREIRFDPNAFDYGGMKHDKQRMQGLGFAGFRVHYALNTPNYKDEVLVFLGASYFRALGKGQVYGLSGRGLAVDTALPTGEEFPRFVEFWIERPSASATQLTIYALLDSPRITGAYRFVLKPGVDTVMEVKARLYPRERIAKLGFAPLTSMFYSGVSQPRFREDYRPQVHDSLGLSVRLGNGEWLWRPLSNPQRLLVTSFATGAEGLGFGLMQRDRRYASFEDPEARYEDRPSAWVEPVGRWGPGRIELVQIPTPDETNDNIVAYWVPDSPIPPRQPFDLEYRLLWQKDEEMRPPTAWVRQTRRGHGFQRNPSKDVGYVIDFDGPALRKLGRDAKPVADIWVDSNASLSEHKVYHNAATGGWRLTLSLRRQDEAKPVEVRAHLRHAGEVVSETWSHIVAVEKRP